jgi:hypothetical protein
MLSNLFRFSEWPTLSSLKGRGFGLGSGKELFYSLGICGGIESLKGMGKKVGASGFAGPEAPEGNHRPPGPEPGAKLVEFCGTLWILSDSC